MCLEKKHREEAVAVLMKDKTLKKRRKRKLARPAVVENHLHQVALLTPLTLLVYADEAGDEAATCPSDELLMVSRSVSPRLYS